MPRQVDGVARIETELFEGLASCRQDGRLDQCEDAGEERIGTGVHQLCDPLFVGERFSCWRRRLRAHALEETLFVGLG